MDSEILLETNGDKNYHVSAYNTYLLIFYIRQSSLITMHVMNE